MHDPHDYAQQIAALRPMLIRNARRRVRNKDWAEDAVSDTIVAALESPLAYAGHALLSTWLVGILKHKLVDQVRRQTRESHGEHDDHDETFNSPAKAEPFSSAGWGDPQHHLLRRQLLSHVDACLRKLPPQQERAILLRDVLGAETEEICSELGVTSNNLAVMLHRARQRVRASLQAQWWPMAGVSSADASAPLEI